MHIAQDRVDFVNLHRYPVSSRIFIFGHNCEEDVLKIRTYRREENALLLHNALYAPGVRCSLLSFVCEISFLFNFHLDVLDIVNNGNFFWPIHIERCFQCFG